MIIDTDVLIWYMRGNRKAHDTIEGQKGFFISVVSYIELVQGMRNKNELTELRKAISNWRAKILYLNEEISAKAMFYIERFYLSHSLELADALIGASAIVYAKPILTANDKHYRAINEIKIKRFRP